MTRLNIVRGAIAVIMTLLESVRRNDLLTWEVMMAVIFTAGALRGPDA